MTVCVCPVYNPPLVRRTVGCLPKDLSGRTSTIQYCTPAPAVKPGPLRPWEVTQLNSYELALILRADVEDEERNAVLNRTKEIITGDKGVIVKIDEWGKRRLAYEIKDTFDGVYYILYFEATAKTLDEVTRVLGITDGVLRFMPIRHEKPFGFAQPVVAPVAEPAPAGEEV
jgi:small subunit ribosomal protein S6